MKKVEDYVVSIPDFPEPGIIFRDVTSVIQDAEGLQLAIDEMQKLLEGVEFDVLAGAESRGFIFGMPIAYNLKKPFVLVRKKGKLPRETVEMSYDLEYAIMEKNQGGCRNGLWYVCYYGFYFSDIFYRLFCCFYCDFTAGTETVE